MKCPRCGSVMVSYRHSLFWVGKFEEELNRPNFVEAICGVCGTEIRKEKRE